MVNAFAVWAIFSFQPVVHNWSIKGFGMCCPGYGKVHIKDRLLLIGKSSLCGDSGFPLKKYVTITTCLMSDSRWYEHQCALEASLNKTNFPFLLKQHKTTHTRHGGPIRKVRASMWEIRSLVLDTVKQMTYTIDTWQFLAWRLAYIG